MAKPMSKTEQRIMQTLLKPIGNFHAWLYRVSGGRFGGQMVGAPVVLLTTRGRKTGQARTIPLLYLKDEDKVIIVASKGGFPVHPAWYLNLQANPQVEVQIGSERKKMRAETASAELKAKYWPELVAMYAGYRGYQARTERDIPVVILQPA